MGLQDRDYYRERSKAAHQSPSPMLRKAKKNSTRIKYLLYLIITIAGLWYGADNLLGKMNGTAVMPVPTNEKPFDSMSSSIILKTDRQGHFRGTALINNVPMPFLIDTGATKTSIPANMAATANLPFGSKVQSSTAGGQVIDRLTRINSLKIGDTEIRNLDANINQYLDEVLIGMNTLKYFHMTQSGNTLTLVANNQQIHRVTNALAAAFDTVPIQQPIAKPVNVKKTVTCDGHKVCKTTYSDH